MLDERRQVVGVRQDWILSSPPSGYQRSREFQVAIGRTGRGGSLALGFAPDLVSRADATRLPPLIIPAVITLVWAVVGLVELPRVQTRTSAFAAIRLNTV